MMILNLRNTNKLRTTVYKNIKENLLFAHDFEFFINYNLMKNLDREVNLMANIPDYISLGYSKEQTEFKSKGTPIYLEVNIEILSK